MIEPADPPLHDVLVPAARREHDPARHDGTIDPGKARLASIAGTHRVIVIARIERRKS
jgi:hypothetical protein